MKVFRRNEILRLKQRLYLYWIFFHGAFCSFSISYFKTYLEIFFFISFFLCVNYFWSCVPQNDSSVEGDSMRMLLFQMRYFKLRQSYYKHFLCDNSDLLNKKNISLNYKPHVNFKRLNQKKAFTVHISKYYRSLHNGLRNSHLLKIFFINSNF